MECDGLEVPGGNAREHQAWLGAEAEACVVARLAEYHATRCAQRAQLPHRTGHEQRPHSAALAAGNDRHRAEAVPACRAIGDGDGGRGDVAHKPPLLFRDKRYGELAAAAERCNDVLLGAAGMSGGTEGSDRHRLDGRNVSRGFFPDTGHHATARHLDRSVRQGGFGLDGRLAPMPAPAWKQAAHVAHRHEQRLGMARDRDEHLRRTRVDQPELPELDHVDDRARRDLHRPLGKVIGPGRKTWHMFLPGADR